MAIEPRNDYVLIERLPEPSKVGSIIIPDIAKETGTKGKILAVGPGKRDEDGILQPLEVKPGDMVYFNSKWNDLSESHYDPDKPAHFDNRLHLVQEGDIIGRINEQSSGKDGRGSSARKDQGTRVSNQRRGAVKAHSA